jgi:hypothetical protein
MPIYQTDEVASQKTVSTRTFSFTRRIFAIITILTALYLATKLGETYGHEVTLA